MSHGPSFTGYSSSLDKVSSCRIGGRTYIDMQLGRGRLDNHIKAVFFVCIVNQRRLNTYLPHLSLRMTRRGIQLSETFTVLSLLAYDIDSFELGRFHIT